MIEMLYLVSGLLLPLFYVPQVIRLLQDKSKLESFSLLKALAQLLLRLPALLFAVFVVDNTYMNIVLTADVLGRLTEFSVAVYSLRRQGMTWGHITDRITGYVHDLVKRFKVPRLYQNKRFEFVESVLERHESNTEQMKWLDKSK